MFRRLLALCVALALFVLPTAAAASTSVAIGTAETTLDLLRLTVAGLPADLPQVSLGTVHSYASTDSDPERNTLGKGQPFALVGLKLPGEQGVEARSTDSSQQPGHEVALPAGLGRVTAGTLSATAGDAAAAAVLEALSGRVGLATLGLSASTPDSGVAATVDGTLAQTRNGAVLSDLDLGLTDLLPRELLAKLPVDVLLRLAGDLDLTLPVDVRGTVDTLRTVAASQAAVETLQSEIDAVQAELDAAGNELAALTAEAEELTTTVETLAAELTGTACQVTAPVEARLIQPVIDLLDGSGLLSTTDTITTLSHDPCHQLQEAVDTLADTQAAIRVVNGTIDELQAELDRLVTELESLLDRLLDLLDRLDPTALLALLEGLLDALEGVSLLSADEIVVGVTTLAQADGSRAEAICEARGVRVLGQDQAVADCDELQTALGRLDTAIGDLLAGLPLAGDLSGNTVKLQGPTVTESADDLREGDFYVAQAGVSGLSLQVQPVTLRHVADTLVGDVRAVLGQLLAGLPADVDAALVDQVTAAADSVLAALVATLPVVDLEGVTTPGLEVAGLQLASTSRFNAAGTHPVPVAAPTTPQDGMRSTPAASGPTLPVTGGGAGLAALALLGAGGAGVRFLRRRA